MNNDLRYTKVYTFQFPSSNNLSPLGRTNSVPLTLATPHCTRTHTLAHRTSDDRTHTVITHSHTLSMGGAMRLALESHLGLGSVKVPNSTSTNYLTDLDATINQSTPPE